MRETREGYFQRGEIWLADLNILKEGLGISLQGGLRPVIIISNKNANRYSPIITCVPVTTKLNKTSMPTHILLPTEVGLKEISMVLGEQIMSVDKKQLIKKIGECNQEITNSINKAVLTQLGISLNQEAAVSM